MRGDPRTAMQSRGVGGKALGKKLGVKIARISRGGACSLEEV